MPYGAHFWNFMAKRYAKSAIADQATYEKKLAASQGYFKPEMRAFEFGCGTGSTALIHAPYVAEYIAADVSKNMLAIAQAKLDDSNINNLHFKQMAIEEWPIEPASFDVVLGLSILHLLDDPEAAIRKVHGMLKPGGIFITSTAAIKDIMPAFRFVSPLLSTLGILPNLQFFRAEEIEQLINNCGFKTEYTLANQKKKDALFLISVKKE